MGMNRKERREAERRLAAELRRRAAQPSPLPQHLRDQQAAAADDAWEGLKRTAALADLSVTETEDPEDPALPALVLAASTRVRDFCPHARSGLPVGVRVMVDLSGCWAACQNCLRENPSAYLARIGADDGCCDICNEPAPGGLFTPVTLAIGSVTWTANIGECCEDKFGVAP